MEGVPSLLSPISKTRAYLYQRSNSQFTTALSAFANAKDTLAGHMVNQGEGWLAGWVLVTHA